MKNSDQSREQLFKELELLRAENSEFKAVLAHRQAAKLKADKQLIANQHPLQQPKEFAETLLEIANVIIVTLDTDANIILFNGFAEKLTGYQKQEVIGKNWFELFIPKDNSTVIPEVFQNVLKEMPEVSSYENHILRRDGSARLISWRNTVLKTGQGAISGILSIGTDVTERKQAESAFLKNKYYLTKAQEIGKIGTWELDIQQNILIWTDENYKIFGVPLGTKMTYEVFLDCIHPADRDYVDKKWRAGLDGDPYDIEHRIIIDNKVKWVREKADITFDIDGAPIRAIGFTQDITERKQAEETLQLTQFSVDHLPDAVYWIGLDAKFIYVNNVAAETLGYSKEELLAMTVYDIDIEFSEERWVANWSNLKTNESAVIHSTHRRKNQTTFPVEITANLINFGGWEITCAIAKDITERKQVEEELKQYREHLEEMVKTRTAELEDKNVELKRFNKLFVGREFRIKELRDKVKALQTKSKGKQA
jgi:PAS domain S-box-containing protein